MVDFTEAKLKSSITHYVGNKLQDDGVVLSKRANNVGEEMVNILTTYFLSSFKSTEYYNLFHDSNLTYNEVFGYATELFENSNNLYEHSVNLAKHLYQQSNHPKIKGGELYVVYFEGSMVDGQSVDAVGLFKSENKDTFLNVYHSDEVFEIESQQGVNINKLDKGALIFNSDKDNGYVVAVVDNTNKGAEAHYWIDDFLHLRPRKDAYYNTQNVMALTKNFVAKELPKVFDGVSKADQAEMLNNTTKFFKENDNFDMDEFVNQVIAQPEVIDSFNQYKQNYAKERDIEFADSFNISDTAVKKQARSFKSVIKLDKNFHIYIHGDRELIEQGEDPRGKFYKVYYNQEQ